VNREELHAVVHDALHRVAPEADLASLSPDADLRTTLDLDSFSMLQVFVALHDRLDVDVPESDAGGLSTVGHIVDYLHERLATRQEPRRTTET
jgi:acyl carrier protein